MTLCSAVFARHLILKQVRIYEYEDEDRYNKQIRKGRVWKRTYIPEL